MFGPLLALLPLAVELLVSVSAPGWGPRLLGFPLTARAVPLDLEARQLLRFERPPPPATNDYRTAAIAPFVQRAGTLVERLGLRVDAHLSVGEATIDAQGRVLVRLTADGNPFSFLAGGVAEVSLREEDACVRIEGRWLPLPCLSFVAWAISLVVYLRAEAFWPVALVLAGALAVHVRSSARMRQGIHELEELVGRRVTTLLAP